MARWKLLTSHYLNVPGIEWTYKEVDRVTGRPVMKKFPVPLLLDPAQPADWTSTNQATGEGEIIVCHEGKGEPRDLTFTNSDGTPGHPTPDMYPMDKEAKAISDTYATRWNHPIESLEGNGPSYADQLLDKLQTEVAEVRSKSSSIEVGGMTELLSAMTAMMKQNQDMMGLIAAGLNGKAPIESLSQPARKV